MGAVYIDAYLFSFLFFSFLYRQEAAENVAAISAEDADPAYSLSVTT